MMFWDKFCFQLHICTHLEMVKYTTVLLTSSLCVTFLFPHFFGLVCASGNINVLL